MTLKDRNPKHLKKEEVTKYQGTVHVGDCESAEFWANLRNQSNVREPRRKHDDPFSKRLDFSSCLAQQKVWRGPGLKPVIIPVGKM